MVSIRLHRGHFPAVTYKEHIDPLAAGAAGGFLNSGGRYLTMAERMWVNV